MIHNIPQPTFEELVARHLVEDGVEVRKNHSFVRCEQVRDAFYVPSMKILTNFEAQNPCHNNDRRPRSEERVSNPIKTSDRL